MKRATSALLALGLCAGLAPAAAGSLDPETAAAGLKEALQVGVGKAVEFLGRPDGFLGTPEVRIPVPEDLESVAKALGKLGMRDVVEDFETSMNRAAESAVPLAREVFARSIREMTIRDALDIVRGDGHEATDYLRENAGAELAERFRPTVGEQLDAVGATRAFERLMDGTSRVPFLGRPAFDLEQYVTDKALDGLFLMVAREEEQIRKDPLARTSDLLKRVFGGGDEREEKLPWWKRLLDRD